MKNLISKKILSLALLGATTSLFALYAEQASLYKDPRIMGMGGANVAVGAYSTAVFSNPAGLANIKKEHGFVFDLLNVGVSATAEVQQFIDDMDSVDTSAADGGASDMLAVLQQYNGQPFHLGVDNYTSLSKNSDGIAWSIGILAATDANYMSHTNGGTDVLVTSSRGYGGAVVGFAKPYETEFGRLDIGISAKYISLQSYEGGLTINDLLSDDVQATLQNKFEKKATGFGVDLGVNYHPWVDSYWHPAIGFSVMDIGTMDMDGIYGGQPTTLNIGFSITPELPILDKFVLAVDYVDLLEANKLRLYDTSSDPVTWVDYDVSDPMKKLRLGVQAGVLDTWLLSLALSGGLYQGAYTAGVNMELFIFKINATTYQEDIGTADNSVADRRYMAQIGIGW